MNMRPVAFLFTYIDKTTGKEFTVSDPIPAEPVRVTHLYSADQMAMVQESIKIESALLLKGVINGDIYANRIRNIEIFK